MTRGGPSVRNLLAALMVCAAAAHAQTAQDATLGALRAEAEQQTSAGNWPALVNTLTRLRALADADGNQMLVAEASHRLGLAHQQVKAYDRARDEFERALAIHLERGNRLNVGQLHDALGLLAWTMGDAEGTRRNYGAAADDYAAAGQVARQVNSLRNMTFAGDMSTDDRIAIVERAVGLAEPLDDDRTKGLVRHQLGDLLNIRGDYDRAIEHLEAAVALLEPFPPLQALALTSLGRTYRLHGLSARAIDIYTRVLALQGAAGDLRGEAQTRDALAVAYSSSGRHSDAITEYERALAAARTAGAQQNLVPFITNNLAATLTENGQPAQAVLLLETLLTAPVEPHLERRARHSLAQAYARLGRLDDARLEFDRAVTASEADPDALVQVLRDRAQLRSRLADTAGAIDDTSRALDALETLRARAAPRDAMKQAFVDQHRALFDLAITLRRDAGDAAGAFDTAERARARAFQDLLASRNLGGATPAGNAAVELPSRASVPPARIADLAARVRATGTTVLAYWVAEDETTIWVVAPDGSVTTAKVAVASRRYEALARQVWQTTTSPAKPPAAPRTAAPEVLPSRSGTNLSLGPDPRPALRELHRLLVAPVQSRLPGADGLITLIPHGPLFGVPFAALVDARNRYLVETYRLHYVSAAALLRPLPPASKKPRHVLLVADPQPMPADGRVPLPALPGARAEVTAVAALLPKADTTVLVGRSATEGRVRGATAGQQAIHLATHGIVRDDRPFDSFLALAPGMADGSDGRLTTGEVYGLRLEADLVVLSGCRTATGQLSGDGVHGLARAFFYAGTPSVVATQWDLPDAPARFLFPEFYSRWLAGADKSAALRTAQRSLIAALRRGAVSVDTPLGKVTLPEHPAVWAGVVLLGEP